MSLRSDSTAAPLAPSLLLRGGTVLTLDDEATVMPAADVRVENGRIVALGGKLEPPAGGEVLDVAGCWVMPGIVQGHVHLGQTFFRGLAEGRRLLPWLRQRIWPLEAAHDDESAYWCALLGASECLLAGTTTIQEIGLGPGIRGLLAAIQDSGLRALAGMCLMDDGAALPEGLRQETDRALAETLELGSAFDGAAAGRLRYLLNPRFVLSCSDELWRGVAELSARQGWAVHTHALEQQEETRAVREQKRGRDEIEYFEELGVLAGDLRIAHGVWLTDRHLARVGGERFSVVHCPSANLKLGSGIADVVKIRRAGVAVGVGADGAPCNNDLDPFEELRLAALLQHLRHGPASFTGLDALRLATSEGARAVGLGDRVGSIEIDKAADLLVLSAERPELLAAARADPHDVIAYGCSRASVRHVVVAGEVLVRDGRLIRLDLAEIRRQAARCVEDLLRRAELPP